MDTKTINLQQGGSSKAGRTDVKKLKLVAGTIVLGAATGVIGGQMFTPATSVTDDPMDADATDTGAADAANAATEQTTPQQTTAETQAQPQQATTDAQDITQPQPIDSNNQAQPAEPQPTSPSHPDQVAQQIAESTEIDASDNVMTFMNVGDSTTLYDADGNMVNAYSVQFNNPELGGQQFLLVDTDGDGIYDGLYTANGEPFNLTFVNEDGSETTFGSLLADARYSQSDMEEMAHNDGSHLARNEHDTTDEDDNPSEDIIDTGHTTQQNLAQNDNTANPTEPDVPGAKPIDPVIDEPGDISVPDEPADIEDDTIGNILSQIDSEDIGDSDYSSGDNFEEEEADYDYDA